MSRRAPRSPSRHSWSGSVPWAHSRWRAGPVGVLRGRSPPEYRATVVCLRVGEPTGALRSLGLRGRHEFRSKLLSPRDSASALEDRKVRRPGRAKSVFTQRLGRRMPRPRWPPASQCDSPGRDRLALAWRQHLDAVFRRLRRRALQSVSALDVTELGRPGGPDRNWVAELGEEPLETGGRDGA
jgi:hypothetical protein